MQRFFAHYTYIYPYIFLKNHIIEIGEERHIVKYFSFENETANTGFHSGLQVFLPYEIDIEAAKQKFISIQPLLAELLDDALIRRFRV